MSSDSLHPGAVLGTWTVDELLQSSPMATTWRAHDGAQAVVLKLFAAPLDPTIKRSVQRAFRKAHGVRIPGVLAPLELRSLPQGLCVVRPWVDGAPLFDTLRTPPSDTQVDRALELGARLFAVVAGLHRDGLVHGQLSPANIWVDRAGHIQITDFGSSVASLRTSPAELPGQLPPTAPEVAAGWGPRPASDVLALGALLYSALTPSVLDHTDRTTPWGLGAAEAPAGLALLRADVPAHLSLRIAQAQALDWAARPTAAELATDLARLSQHAIPAPLPSCPLRIGQAGPLDAAVQHLLRPGPRMVVIAGPAGSGRHRLAEALARVQLRSQRPPITIRADRAETGSIPARVLRRLAGPHQHLARRRRLFRGVSAPLASLWPELVPDPEHTPESEGETDATDILDAAVAVAHRALADRPALVVIDRLEDADPLSLRWLHRWINTDNDLRCVVLVDSRWQSEELRRMRGRLEERAAVLEVVLPDLTTAEARRVYQRLLRAVPDVPSTPLTQAASPARATEHAHAVLAEWRGEAHPPPGAAATLFALLERIPTAAVRAMGFDPAQILAHHLAVPDGPGWLRCAHDGVRRLGRRGLARRDRMADRLVEALVAAGAPWRDVAQVALMGSESARTAAARAAVEAWDADRPAATTQWLVVVDRLPRASTDPGYRLIRAPLARVRAEVAHTDPQAPVRSDLLRQAVRRARSPDELAALACLRGSVALQERGPTAALDVWLTGSEDPAAHPGGQARCAWYALELGLSSGALDAQDRALRALRHATGQPDLPRGPRRWRALAEAKTALSEGDPSRAVQHLERWLASPDGPPDPAARSLLAWAHHVQGADERARHHVHHLLDADPHNAEARALHGWLALHAGDTRAAARALRQLDDPASAGPVGPMLELLLAATQGEAHRLPALLGRPAPSQRPDLWAVWMATVLDALRTIDEPGLRLARLDMAQTAAPQHPYAALHLALAWHHLDDRNTPLALEAAQSAGALADAAADSGRALRAAMLHAFLSRSADHLWRERVAQATPHPSISVRHDVGELSALLALDTGSPDVAEQWVRYLSDLAVQAPDHALAARATRVHRAIQRARSAKTPSTGPL